MKRSSPGSIEETKRGVGNPRLVFVAKFLGVMLFLYIVIALNPVNDHVIVPFTELITRVTGWFMRLVGSDVTVRGTVMESKRFALDVRNGCNGIEAMILLAAAIFAFPATLGSRLIGLISASVAIQFVNLVRLCSLFWLGEHHRSVFDFFHVAVWQSLVILAAISVFVLWSWKFAQITRTEAR